LRSLPYKAGVNRPTIRRTSTPPQICRRPTTIRSSTDIRRHLRDVISSSGQLSHPTATIATCAESPYQLGRRTSTPPPIRRRPTTIRSSTDIRRHLRYVISSSGQLSLPTRQVFLRSLPFKAGVNRPTIRRNPRRVSTSTRPSHVNADADPPSPDHHPVVDGHPPPSASRHQLVGPIQLPDHYVAVVPGYSYNPAVARLRRCRYSSCRRPSAATVLIQLVQANSTCRPSWVNAYLCYLV